jgi:alpha-1,3-glucosyltransferase
MTFTILEKLYMLGFVAVQLLQSLFVESIVGSVATRFEFLPLMAVSVYSAIGIAACWVRLFPSLHGNL